jgi:hypothetical protein
MPEPRRVHVFAKALQLIRRIKDLSRSSLLLAARGGWHISSLSSGGDEVVVHDVFKVVDVETSWSSRRGWGYEHTATKRAYSGKGVLECGCAPCAEAVMVEDVFARRDVCNGRA